VYREGWEDCFGQLESGADCLTPKGLLLVQVELTQGCYVDLYDIHADAGMEPGDKAARAANFNQLARVIAERSAGKAVIVAGDFNERYTTDGGTLAQFLADTGLTDVWVELEQAGQIPEGELPPELAETCGQDVTELECERIDKVLYRSSDALLLTPTAYQVDAAKFSDAQGQPLSDHPPVSVVFSYTSL
jgi:endonuclease/exonuclease/phosphatase family metal-dependent hydrolase